MSIPLLFSKRAFHPRQIFAALQGAWLEPTLGWIFTDTAGTSAITTGGQTIGRINDQSGGGNHAAQSVNGNRPLLGRRYNLLTYSEDFSNAAWLKLGAGVGSTAVVTPNYGAAPDGTQTAVRIQCALNGGTSTSDYSYMTQTTTTTTATTTGSWWLKTTDGSTKNIFVRGGNQSVITITGTWAKYTFNTGILSVAVPFAVGLRGGQATPAADSADILAWHPDLRLTSDVGKDPAYQRITTATDYDVGQYPAAVHDTTDSLVVSLPNLGGGIYSAAGSVYFATPQGMSALHGQSMGLTYTLPALSTDIYSWIVVPQRLNTVQESRLARYMERRAGIAGPDTFEQEDYGPELIANGDGTTLTGWTTQLGSGSSITPVAGEFYFVSTGGLSQIIQVILTAGKYYSITFSYRVISGFAKYSLGGVTEYTLSGSGTVSEIRLAAGADFYINRNIPGQAAEFYIDNISVRELKDGMTGQLFADDGDLLLRA